MRLLFTCNGVPRPDALDGISYSTYRLTESLATFGHEVMVLSPGAGEAPVIPGVEVMHAGRGPRSWKLAADLRNRIREWSPDVVLIMSCYSPFNTQIARWCAKVGLPYVVRPAGGYGQLNEARHWVRKRAYKFLFEKRMLNNSAFVWATGDEESIRAYGVEAPVFTTTKGLDLNRRPKPDRSLVPALAHSRGRFVFGFVGRIDPFHKGLDLAVAGFRSLNRDDCDFVVVGPVDSQAGRLFRDAEEDEHVRFPGPLLGEERDRFLSSIDSFVHLSRWEGGLPYSVIQAAYMAAPLLLTRGADPASFLFDNDACLRVELDVASVVSGMELMIDLGPEEREALGERASKLVSNSLGWERMASGLIGWLVTIGIELPPSAIAV